MVILIEDCRVDVSGFDLSVAIKNASDKVVELLLSRKEVLEDLNSGSYLGNTPLLVAAGGT